jgi:hypothetical protein
VALTRHTPRNPVVPEKIVDTGECPD